MSNKQFDYSFKSLVELLSKDGSNTKGLLRNALIRANGEELRALSLSIFQEACKLESDDTHNECDGFER